MAVDPDDLDRIAATVAGIYRETETALAELLARHLAGDLDRDIPAPVWAEKKLAAARTLRRSTLTLAARLQARGAEALRDAAADAYRAGDTAALLQLGDERDAAEVREALDEMPGFAAVEAMANAVFADIGEKSRNILRDVEDAYREVITAATARIITGAQTRRQAAQAAWQRLVNRGITGFTDRAGRRWQLSSYVEMATRTVAQRAAITGETDRLRARGLRLVYVSNAPQECERCRPYEGEVLRLDDGPTGDITVPHQLTDQPVAVHVVATLADAQLDGLFHPNCRHSVSAYLPGVTRLPAKPTADLEGDTARQQQRALERRIRRHKLAQRTALDPAAATVAGRKVRAAQAALREHLADHPDLKRLPYRESIGAGSIPPAGRGQPTGELGRELDPRDVPPPPEPLDLSTWTDDQLEAGVAEYADDEPTLLAIIAELDRRDAAPAEPVPTADDGPDAERWAFYDQLVADGVDEQQAYADAFDKDPERVRREEAIQRLRAENYTGRGFDELARAAYVDELERQYFLAEAATNGFLLIAAGQRAQMDPRTLWKQNEAYARKWASDELKEWWDRNGRITFDQFAAQLLSGQNEQRHRTGGETWLR